MRISENRVVTLVYTLRDLHPAALDGARRNAGRRPRAAPGEPAAAAQRETKASLDYLHGHESILPDLEQALDGKSPGDRVSLTIPPERAYGERDASMVREVPRTLFGDVPVNIGGWYEATGPDGESADVQVTAADARMVTVDANHPLAGCTLHIEATVVEVRPATGEELAQGGVVAAPVH
jgi:FKBP-type peptidyl-prolyl cis-trans isomerase SlyD